MLPFRSCLAFCVAVTYGNKVVVNYDAVINGGDSNARIAHHG